MKLAKVRSQQNKNPSTFDVNVNNSNAVRSEALSGRLILLLSSNSKSTVGAPVPPSQVCVRSSFILSQHGCH
jgi:hypothetical protein